MNSFVKKEEKKKQNLIMSLAIRKGIIQKLAHVREFNLTDLSITVRRMHNELMIIAVKDLR
jgi:hypothetical protein